MEEKHLSIKLREQAIKLGLCKQWQDEWKENSNKQSLIDRYFEGLDFPMKHHWPTNEFIKENFEQELLRKNNILVDDTRSLLNPKEAVILGISTSTIRVNGDNHSVIYVRDNACVEIRAKHKALVIIHVFEEASVRLEICDTPNVLVLKHSAHCLVSAPSNVKIKEDLNYLK